MSDGEALLRGILECPEDDTARLVYADYLDEQGEPERAEFIRVQVFHPDWFLDDSNPAHSGVDDPAYHRACIWLKRRADDDLFALVGGYCSGVHGRYVWHRTSQETPDVSPPFTVRWGRGFVESLTCTAADFLAHAAAIFSRHPVTTVRLSDVAPGGPWDGDGDAERGKVFWYDGGDIAFGRHRHHLPRELCPLGEGTRPAPLVTGGSRKAVFFSTPDEAHAALSRRCVALGRELARAELGVALGVSATES